VPLSRILAHAGDDGRALRLAGDSSLSLSSTAAGWRHVKVEQQVLPPTELRDRFLTEHLLSVQIRPARVYDYRNAHGRAELRPEPGDVVFTPAWLVSSFTWCEEIEVLNVALDPAFVDGLAAGVVGTETARFPCERHGPDPQARMIGLALAAEARAREDERGGDALADALATALAVRLLRRYASRGPYPREEPSRRRADALAARVRERVDAALDHPLTLSDLAAAENLSPFHFARMFKSATGVPPYRYVTQRRVERAKHLVLTSDLPVAEIARRCGFAAPAQMTRAFRRILSVTPTGLRRRR
jgi:AraC family transcriptional regulator